MAYDNIKFRKYNMTVAGGCFYMFDEDWGSLVEKLDDGSTSFAYPLNTLISNPIKSLEYDKVNFWSLEDPSGDGIIIRRWQVESNTCNLKDTFDLSPGYSSEAFTVEHYHTTVATTISGGYSNIQVSKYYDTVISGSVTLTLGPNNLDQYEDVIVDSVSGTNITLTSGTQYSYEIGDEVNFYLYLWVFNNDGSGSLCQIDALTGNLLNQYNDSEYDNITACTFARISNVFTSNVDALIYVKSTNLKFVNVNTLNNYGVMTMDNKKVNQSVIPIYDLAISGETIYRLQDEATYYGVNNDWGALYNYQASVVRPFIDAITVTAFPLILPANARNITQVIATVLDQYGNGAKYKPVFFTDSDDVGYILINPAYTDYFFGTGQAKTAYRAGVDKQTVNIKGTVTQYD
jgi:hypothetical protein